MSDLVEVLREVQKDPAEHRVSRHNYFCTHLAELAADELERKDKDLESARMWAEQMEGMLESYQEASAFWKGLRHSLGLDALPRHIEAWRSMKGALVRISRMGQQGGTAEENLRRAVDIAAAALSDARTEGGDVLGTKR